MLSRRPHASPCLGLWLRQLPGLRAQIKGMGEMAVEQDLRSAVDQALAGDWQAAHVIVQRHEGEVTADWIHAVLHKIEGDGANSRYWYGQAGRNYEAHADPKAELGLIKSALGGAGGSPRDAPS